MKFADVAPIIEGKLHAYGLMRMAYPTADIASYSKREGRVETHTQTSPQEEWAIRFGQEIRDMAIIDDTLRKLSEDHRTLVRMRYVHKERWNKIAEAIHVSDRQVHRERDSVIAVFAYAFGMMDETGQAAAGWQ